MTEPSRDRVRSEVSLVQLLPNMLTISALGAGLSALRYGILGDFSFAVKLILLACLLDALDGRLARALSSDSALGAELDSLADFLNFGVVPPVLIYLWALQDMRSEGWIADHVFAGCCVLRLARFNVGLKSESARPDSAYFVGVPAPAGAMLVLLPMFLSFAASTTPILPPVALSLYMVLIGLLMISRIPTWSFKRTTISRGNVKVFLVVFAFIGAALLTFLWVTLATLCIVYVGFVLWALVFKPSKAPSGGT